MHRKRIIAVLLLIIATIITIATAFKTGINPPAVNVAGSFGAILFLLATAKILDVKDDLFYCGVIFCIFGVSDRLSFGFIQKVWPI